MRTLGSLLLLAAVAVGCDRSGSTEPAPTADPPPPTTEELEQLLKRAAGPAPELGIRIDPPVRAWETRADRWALEATVTVTNRGETPVDLDTSRLRVRDQERPLSATVRGAEDRPRLAPGASRVLEVTASQHPSDSGQPTVLRVDYGTVGGMTPEVTAPVTAVPTTGLVATFGDVQPARQEQTPYVHGRGSLPKWQVRLSMEIHNPTDHLLRMPFGGLGAVREDGTSSYWGDHAGVSIDDRWFDPGERRTARVTLMFDDSPSPPSRITLTYGDGEGQTVDVPAGGSP